MAVQKQSDWVRVQVTGQGNIQDVAEKLKAQGMQVESVLDAIGVVTGQVREDKLAQLQRIPGVVVERESTVQLPPPDAPVQ